MRKTTGLTFIYLAIFYSCAYAESYPVDAPSIVFTGKEFSITLTASDRAPDAEPFLLRVAGQAYSPSTSASGQMAFNNLVISSIGSHAVEITAGNDLISSRTLQAIPGWYSLLPPLLAIAMALIFRSVVPALFLGIVTGAWAAGGFGFAGLLLAPLNAFQDYIKNALANPDHAAVILFTMMTGGMVGILAKNGAMPGVVKLIVKWADSSRRAMLSTAALGVSIFFDDYANTLLVGKTMQPVTDRLRISREKLAYIVDSTAAPIACIAFVTTWVGTQISLISNTVATMENFNEPAYAILLNSIPYSFYPIMTLAFLFMVSASNRDFGPMYQAEKSARSGNGRHAQALKNTALTQTPESPGPDKDIPHSARNFFIPILALVFTLLTGLYTTGEGETLSEIVGSSDAYKALMWASFTGACSAGLLSLVQGILTLDEVVDSWYAGVKATLFAMLVLVLAWSLSTITQELRTADYMISIIGDSLAAELMPAIIFVLAALAAFATGSSWGAMGIMIPLVIPLVWGILEVSAMAEPAYFYIIHASVASILAGAVWGDHCSPISDTTILSSMSSGCDHIAHVHTQLPYAITVALVAIVFGIIPAGYGLPLWLCLLVAIAILWGIIKIFGHRTENFKLECTPD